jgi:hypothetical protein
MRYLRSAAATGTDQEMRTAIARVYETYGRDLGVFVEHVREVIKKSQTEDKETSPKEGATGGNAERRF